MNLFNTWSHLLKWRGGKHSSGNGTTDWRWDKNEFVAQLTLEPKSAKDRIWLCTFMGNDEMFVEGISLRLVWN